MTETDIFLEHFGVRGMKWGRRKERNSSVDSKGMSTKTKAAIGVAGVAGAATLAYFLNKKFKVKVSDIPIPSQTSRKEVASFVNLNLPATPSFKPATFTPKRTTSSVKKVASKVRYSPSSDFDFQKRLINETNRRLGL